MSERTVPRTDGPEPHSHSVFVPMALMLATLFIAIAFQLFVLVKERQLVRARLDAQQAPLEEVQKIRSQLQAIAQSTVKLSASGNKNATLVIQRLKQAGILVTQDGVRPNQ